MIEQFPNKYLIKLSNEIMLDKKINKMIYYNEEKQNDIYSLEDIENPIKKLKEKKVFINRKVPEVLKESDISVFVNIYRDFPYTGFYQPSYKIQQFKFEVGVICHNDCRFTLNGLRDILIYKDIEKMLKTNKNLKGIGFPTLEQTYPMYNMPNGFTGYMSIYKLEYFEGM